MLNREIGKMKVSRCIATYNGEDFICDQINSILNQKFNKFKNVEISKCRRYRKFSFYREKKFLKSQMHITRTLSTPNIYKKLLNSSEKQLSKGKIWEYILDLEM